MDRLSFEKEVWSRIFNEACRIISSFLKGVEDWPRAKMMLAEMIAKILLEKFATIRFVGVVELSGGEYVEDYEGGFDIDLLLKVDSEAEAYALKNLEPVIDNALKEAIVYSKDREFLKRMSEKYGKGIYHNMVELHVNNLYVVTAELRSPYSPVIALHISTKEVS